MKNNSQPPAAKCTCESTNTWHQAACDLVGRWAKERGNARGNGPVDLDGWGPHARARDPGRSEAEDVLADLIAVVDMVVQAAKEKVQGGGSLSPQESGTLANFGRVLTQAMQVKAARKPGEGDIDDDTLFKEARAIEKKYKHAAKQAPT